MDRAYLAERASTVTYDIDIVVNSDDTWSYDETTMLKTSEFPEAFAHTDRNTLHRVS